MEMVNITIDGQKVQVPSNYTVLEAARKANIDIPTLCYLKGVNEIGACRMCVVEIKGGRALQAACVYPVSEGLEVMTNTKKVRDARKVNLELILSNHNRNCLTCIRNQNCELQSMADALGVTELRFEGQNDIPEIDDLSKSIVRDNSKCILCRRCISTCKNIQTVGVIDATERGFNTKIACAFDESLANVACTNCGQCITACPVGALYEKDSTQAVWDAIADPDKYVVVQTAPAVRAALGEEFGMDIGTPVTGKMITALRLMGFDKVFDTDTGADITIMEEGTELLNRIQNGGKLPLITSCSPGWVKFCEHFYPDFLDNLSSAKSPQMMFGALLKSYYAEKENIDPEKMVVVSVMPCVAKKFEVDREEMMEDVDYSITTRELARMIKQAGIQFANLQDSTFDNPCGEASGAAVIFGATGGVMEAALRTVAEILNKKPLDNVEFVAVRGVEGIKEATVEAGGLKLKAAVVSGLGNARKLLDKIRAGEAEYHFVEIMACPGGCVTGGGQPIRDAKLKMDIDLRSERAKALYTEDRNATFRKSHENPFVKEVYETYLGEPCSHKAHELLHTHYQARSRF